jgi:hypothetical protein
MNAVLPWVGLAFSFLGALSAVAWHRPDIEALRPLRRILERLPRR